MTCEGQNNCRKVSLKISEKTCEHDNFPELAIGKEILKIITANRHHYIKVNLMKYNEKY